MFFAKTYEDNQIYSYHNKKNTKKHTPYLNTLNKVELKSLVLFLRVYVFVCIVHTHNGPVYTEAQTYGIL
jgi:hypothetical protein